MYIAGTVVPITPFWFVTIFYSRTLPLYIQNTGSKNRYNCTLSLHSHSKLVIFQAMFTAVTSLLHPPLKKYEKPITSSVSVFYYFFFMYVVMQGIQQER